MQGVFGGEADARPGPVGSGGPRCRAWRPATALAMAAASGDGSSQAESSMASAMSMPTSVSASRWPTAWNEPIGRPNWMRLRACSQARSSMVRDAPISSWARARRPRASAAGQGPVRRLARPVGQRAPPGHLDAATGPGRCPRPSRKVSDDDGHGYGDRAPAPVGVTTTTEPRAGKRGGSEPAGPPGRRRRPSRVDPTDRSAGAPSRSRSRRPRRGRGPTPGRGPRRWRWPRPAARTASEMAVCGSVESASGHPSSVERRVEGGARVPGRWRRARLRSNSAAVLAVHQRSFPRSRRRRAMMLRWISALPP